ncbi:MAG: ABC transporter permease, partial [Acidobacteriota bacterium]
NLSKEMLVAFEDSAAFASLSGYHGANFTLTGTESPEEIPGLGVVPGYFAVLGVQPALGRTFENADRVPGAEPVVILSHGLWERHFGSDPQILGRTITLQGLGIRQRTVVGVLPAGFQPMGRPNGQLWTPLVFDPSNLDNFRDMLSLRSVARLSPATTLEQARAEVRTIARRLQQAQPNYHSDEQVRTADVMPLHDLLTGGVRPALWMLAGAVGFVLLIGCSNIANMLLARSGARQREMAVRSALGAGRARLLRQVLTECTLLGLLGGATGVLAAAWLESVLVGNLPAYVPRSETIGIGFEELAFALALSLLASLAFGILPAWRATRSAARSALSQGQRGSTGRRGQRLNQSLVVAEVALSVVLVAGAGLMLKSLWRLQQVEPGFTADNLWALRLSPTAERYAASESLSAYYQEVLARLEAEPGIVSAAAINLLPMTTANLGFGYTTEDQPETPQMVSIRAVTPGYFRTLGVPLLSGRALSGADRVGAAEVGLVNQALVRRHWPNEDPVGKQIRWDDGSPWFTIIGVVGDVHQHRLDRQPKPEVYRPLSQAYGEILSPAMHITLRTSGDTSALLPAVRAAIWTLDNSVPISNVASLRQVIDSTLNGSRFLTQLLCTFGALALLLGGLGIYGVSAYAVSRRTREIGVRMALGARRRAMLRAVMARALLPVALGTVLGLTAALATTRVLASSLFGVSATDPATFLAVAAVLGLVAVLASYLPARRAAEVDPVVALRSP